MLSFFEKHPNLLLENPELLVSFQEISELIHFKKGELLHVKNSICTRFLY